MKRLLILSISLFLLLGQWGSLEHLYHDHHSGEACDYCLQLKSLDQLGTDTAQNSLMTNRYRSFEQSIPQFISLLSSSFFSIRAPPYLA